jgi:Holliday junction resolvase
MQHLKKTTEQKIQTKIIKKLEAEGYYVLKLIKTNKNGIPDLLAIKNNECLFVEVKREDGKLSEIQKYRIKELNDKGINAKVWFDYECDFKTT